MNRLYSIMLFFLILFTVGGCGGRQHITHEVVKPDGSTFPDPHYVIQTIDPRTPIRVTFFFSAVKEFRDLDHKMIPQEKFLDRNTHHLFLSKDEESVKLVARVLNPKNLKYKIFCIRSVQFKGGGSMDSRTLVAYSDMKYREFTRVLPVNEKIKEVTYNLEVRDFAENLLVRTGNFHYYIQ